MSLPIIYGIPNCDTVKKVFAWFKTNKIAFEFHNYKTDRITAAKIKEWCNLASWQLLLNKKSTTWKNIAPGLATEITTQAQAIKLMEQHTSLIKRPVIEINGTILIGFNEPAYAKQLLNK
ncbi:MAG: Spx/MgsR family RNA polymerase-binding regulatory protein [Ferruginibacter sp.]